MSRLNGCIAKDGEEIDGREFDVDNLKDFVEILKGLKTDGISPHLNEQVHLNYFDDDEDLDLWLQKT